MKVLIVANKKSGQFSPFVMDQVEELKKLGVDFIFYPVMGKGIKGYLSEIFKLKRVINTQKPDLIHAHYGLSGLLANLQRKVPVITTFHGSDINVKSNQKFSKLTYRLSKGTIFVSKKLRSNLGVSGGQIIPCGIDLDLFQKIDKVEARKQLGWNLDKQYVLFSSGFDRSIKNYPLAKEVMSGFDPSKVELKELKGYSRKEIPIVMSASDCALVTSNSESGPLFVQEAIACQLPVVSVNVGEVENYFEGTEGNYLVTRVPSDIRSKVEFVLSGKNMVNSHQKELNFCNKSIAERVLNLYKSL